MSIRSTLPVSVPRREYYAAPTPGRGICWAGSADQSRPSTWRSRAAALTAPSPGRAGSAARRRAYRIRRGQRSDRRGAQRSEARFRCGRRRTSGRQTGVSNVVAPACVPCFVGTTAAQPVRLAKRELYARSSPTSMRAGRWDKAMKQMLIHDIGSPRDAGTHRDQ